MPDTNNAHPTITHSNPTALVLFMTESDDLLAAIVPTSSDLAVAAKRFHDLPVGEADTYDDFEFVERWFFDSTAKAEVCPMGELKDTDCASIVAIYKVGC